MFAVGRPLSRPTRSQVLRGQLHRADVPDPDERAVLPGAHDDVGELIGGLQPAQRGHRQGELGARRRGLPTQRPRRIGGVLLLHRVADIPHRDAELGHPVGIEPEGHGEVEPAEDERVAHAVEPLDLVHHVELGVVGEVGGVVAGIVRGERGDQEDVGLRLLDHHTLPAHLLRKLRLGHLDGILHVHRGDVLVPIDVEVDLEVHHPGAGVRRLVVEQPVEPGELLLDRRGDRLGYILRGRAGIGRAHLHGRRGDLGIARHRQTAQREQPQEDDDDGDHRRQHRTADEEVADLLILLHGSVAHDRSPASAAVESASLVESVAALSATGTGCTTLPGIAFWTPSTTTRSPGVRPRSMIQLSPLHGPGVTS